MRRTAYLTIFVTLIWILFLAFGAGPVPALGPLFEVRGGIWQHESSPLTSRDLPGLRKPVLVTIDASGVPHLFAESAGDLFRAQGFVTASQRLFQLDVNTRQTAGNLSAIFGPKALYYDEFFTRFGLRKSAVDAWTKYSQDPSVKEMVESYVGGINSWIDQMPELAPEYKIFGVRPEKFDPVKVVNMGRALTWSLSGRSFDLQLTGYLRRLGAGKTLDLFPEYLPDKYEDYVFPDRLGRPHEKENAAQFAFVSGLTDIPKFPLANPGRGSNNWVVGPAKSTTGRSILANDTHLSITLPSTWYENQLSCPEFNVYGVSLAAIPGVVAGFNKDVAWGPTNGTTDVLDFFEVEFENESSTRYKSGDGWEQALVRKEQIAVKGSGTVTLDIVETKLGPVLHREGKLGLVADWTGYRPGNELRAILKHASVKTARECMAEFSDWLSPIQNFLCADKDNIGFVHAGFVPKRASGAGRFITDGRADAARLTTPVDQVPQSFNPKAGYLLSANQKIVPADYPDYLGWDYEPPFRAMTIRRALNGKPKLSPEDMIALQNENLDLQAEMLLPALLRHLDDDGPWVKRLRDWDYKIRAAQAEGAVFKTWWQFVKEDLFADELQREVGDESKTLLPKDARVAWLFDRLHANPQDTDVHWVDNVHTPDHKETLNEIVTGAFAKALRRMNETQGQDESRWSWKMFNQTRFMHAGRLPGFGSPVLDMDGSSETVRGQSGGHGAVYKAVIATGDWPEAWMQVPGGNEGDPFAKDFGRFVNDWAAGKMRKVEFYRNREEALQKAVRVIHLQPGSGP